MTWTILFSPSFVRVFPSQDEVPRSTRPVYRAPDKPLPKPNKELNWGKQLHSRAWGGSGLGSVANAIIAVMFQDLRKNDRVSTTNGPRLTRRASS